MTSSQDVRHITAGVDVAGEATAGTAGRFPLPARLRNALPAGTLSTGAGVAILGLAAYVHLAIAGHTLTPDQMADLSVLWSVVYTVGYGLFLPIEQELTRVVVARQVRAVGSRPAWRAAWRLTAGVFAGLAALALVSGSALADQLFVGDLVLVLVMIGGLLGVAATSPVRGQAAGAARFDLYGGLLGLDGAIRIVLAVALAVVGAGTAVAFGLVLVIAPVLATVLLFVPTRRTAHPGPPARYAELGRAVWPLVVSMLLSQFLLNSVIVGARLIAPERDVLVAALLSALVLIRVPTLAFGALQASLLSGLAGAAAARDRSRFRALMWQATGLITAMMVAFAALMVGLGPWLVRVLFAAPDVLSRLDFAILTAGTWCFLMALALGQAAMSLHRHRDQTVAWVAGVIGLIGVALVPGPVVARLEWAYLAGNAIVAVWLAGVILLRGPLHWPDHE